MNRIRDLTNSDITQAAAGTGTTLPVVGDTALGTIVANTKNTTTNTVSSAPATLIVEHVITTAEGIASDLTEWGVYGNSAATLMTRTVTASITKTSTQELIRFTTFEFTQD